MLGLFNGNTKRPTRHGLKVARELRFAAEGRAAVVDMPPSIAREYKGQYRVKGRKVIVPKAPGERVRFNKTRKEITSSRKFGGKIITARKPRAVNSPYDLPRGPNIRYAVPFGGGRVRIRWDSFDQLLKDMEKYETSKNAYKNWWRYVEIEEISDDDSDDEGDE